MFSNQYVLDFVLQVNSRALSLGTVSGYIPATVLRWDGHYDELHLCIPGIIHTWLQLFYNILLNVFAA
jgi:hypothetical protein